jgi:hypothetical protein
MAKKKKPVQTPKSPPRDLRDAVLYGCRAEITEQECSDYVRYIFATDRDKASEKQKKAAARAVLMFAALGFSFYNATREQEA